MTVRTRGAAVVVSFITIVLFVPAPAASQTNGGEPENADEAELTEYAAVAARSRIAFGLDGDPELVRTLAVDPEAIERGGGIGFPVAENELADLRNRLDVQEGSGAVFAHAERTSPQTYAGGWIDVREGAIVVAFTDDGSGRMSDLQSVARRPDAIRIVTARFSLAEVSTATDLIWESADLAAAAGIEIGATALNQRTNQVEVSVRDVTVATAGALAQVYSVPVDLLAVDEFVADEVEENAPLGGHSIQTCSSGAFAYIDTVYGRAPYLVTAGHCASSLRHNSSGIPDTATHDPTFTVNREVNAGAADGQKMNLGPSPWFTTTQVEGWQVGDFTITSGAAYHGDFDQDGAVVCQAGSRTRGAANCGEITSVQFNCGSHTNMRRVTYNSMGGDSGATVYGFTFLTGVPLAGIHEGYCNNARRYTFHTNLFSPLDIDGWYTG